jgi:hypothetical protein
MYLILNSGRHTDVCHVPDATNPQVPACMCGRAAGEGPWLAIPAIPAGKRLCLYHGCGK